MHDRWAWHALAVLVSGTNQKDSMTMTMVPRGKIWKSNILAMYGSFIFFHAISTYFTKSHEKLGVHVPLATLGSSTQSASNTGRGVTQLGTGELFDKETIRSISMTFEASPWRKNMAVAGTPRPGTALQFSWHENRRRVFRWRWPNGITLGCIHRP